MACFTGLTPTQPHDEAKAMKQSTSDLRTILVTAVITALVVGGLFSLWPERERDSGMPEKVAEEKSFTPDEQLRALEEKIAGLLQQVETLQQENEALRASETEALKAVEGLKERLAALPGDAVVKEQPSSQAVSHKPRAGWEKYFPGQGTTTLVNETVEQVAELLGQPPFLVRSTAFSPEHSREVWIFLPYEGDPTGLYLYFKGGRFHKSRLDEFNGLPGSAVFMDHEFWFN